MSRLRSLLLADGLWPILTLCGLTTLLTLRMLDQPLVSYGEDGAAWIEHLQRLEVLSSWREHGPTGIIEFLRQADDYFPPGLHIITSLLILVTIPMNAWSFGIGVDINLRSHPGL